MQEHELWEGGDMQDMQDMQAWGAEQDLTGLMGTLAMVLHPP